MNKLEKLYSIIQYSKDTGVKLGEDVLRQVEELEEEIIKKEILPSLSENIEPMLSQIKRDLVLVVEYSPNSPLSVRLSRKMNIAEALDAKKLEVDPEVEHKSRAKEQKKGNKKSPKTGLCVYFPDESYLQEQFAADTFSKAIAKAGLLKVRDLGIILSGAKLVSTTKDKKYPTKEVEPGLYVITHCSTMDKKRILDKISKSLNLRWRVEIIK